MFLIHLRRYRPFSALSSLLNFRSFATKSVDDQIVSTFLTTHQTPLSSSEIKVVDSDTWELSSGLANMSKSYGYGHRKTSFCVGEFSDEACRDGSEVTGELGFDEIEDMRVHGNLFYKIDRGSKEFEEYAFDYHGRKPRYGNKGTEKEVRCRNEPSVKGGKNSKRKEEGKENNKERIKQDDIFVEDERVSRIIEDKYIVCDNAHGSQAGKKLRKPTFNQITGPYHEPFCLDVFISKESVRACVVHRLTSKVVTVAHSISKDMKFDLGSTRNAAACAAVGKVLALRSLADDIHDVIFTPRKGDKLEGKLQVVLQSLMDNGINVKVKLKKRNAKKSIVYNAR